MNGFNDVPSIKPDHATLNVTWTVLIQIRLNCVFFAGRIPPLPLRFIACIQIQSSYSGRFIFLHLSTLPRSDFPGSNATKQHYIPTCFVLSARITKFLFFYAFFHGACKPVTILTYLNSNDEGPGPKCLKTELTNMARRHFFSLPFTFSYRHFVSVICLFWHILTARDDTRDRDANSSRQNDTLFCRGNKSSSRSLLP